MQLEKNEFTTDSLLKWLEKKYETKVSGKAFSKNDIGQYLKRDMMPYRYGGEKLTSKKVNGIRVITKGEENKQSKKK